MDAEYFETVLKNFQRESNISRVLWIKKEPAVPVGENCLSTVYRVTIGVELESGRNRALSVIIKAPLEKQEATYHWMIESGIFDEEIKFFANVSSEMNELMYEFNDKRGKLLPEVIGIQSKLLIFEDLKQYNFKVTDRIKCHDFLHSKLVVRSLARLHAMSRVLLRRRSISSTDIPRHPIISKVKTSNKLYGSGLKLLSNEIKTWGEDWVDISLRLLKFSDTIGEKLEALNNASEDNFNVINHGDCWVCNLMFKYDPYENIPIDLRFVDFQFVHYESYAWDIIFYIYTSIRGDLRRKHYNDLLRAYHKSLSDTLLLYKYPEHEIPSLDDVFKEVERLNVYAAATCLITHTVMTMPVQQSFDMDKCLAATNADENYGYNLDVFRGMFKDEIGPDIKRFAELGVF
ncbi:hypothetical protein O3M35_001099 [Rhynocoris fuscipes]|uniref:CHK kinase-like domain-containing protein n=1 Tax=Rhynocoris fuscipes TaxID=488301 RepID=A0AAW1DR26_9HEMI